MLRGAGVVRSRFVAFTPFLRSCSVNFFKSDGEHAKRLWLKTHIFTLSCRNSSNRTMHVRQSKFVNEKFCDELHFFFMCGAVPCVLVAFLVNTLLGQAELVETPEDYEPHYWEYYKHPITRFISRHMMWSPQQVYENNLAYQKRAMESLELVAEEKWFQESELAHRDYRGWQFIPVNPAGVLRKGRLVFAIVCLLLSFLLAKACVSWALLSPRCIGTYSLLHIHVFQRNVVPIFFSFPFIQSSGVC
ncbi:NADH ubiquinone oxidoreductase sgdh subunit [Echinococcus multilocularis]|uniref:NADH dehydrogenase [ubiquinone] 1 beta subcomplex subunit 5, mitochondrial n=1 Tax=Echinococcus multilocularis TaxID=6211 RepID=A0A068XXU6_ECHMU|nr:NADH ubiquinone oxidoreductase sgdh subunit [Echinococcus multilocularis]